MKKYKKISMILLLACVMISVLGCNRKEEQGKKEIVIFLDSSLKKASEEIKSLYEKENKDITLTFVYNASGANVSNISNGARADVFIAASLDCMNEAVDKQLVKVEDVSIIMEDELVLITSKELEGQIKEFEDITSDKVNKIAMGELSSEPLGEYARTIYKNMNLWDKLSEKVLYAYNCESVLSYVESGNADCAVVYATDAITTDDVIIVCKAPQNTYDRVVYVATPLTKSTSYDEAKKFVDFLKKEEAIAIFEKYGYKKFEE